MHIGDQTSMQLTTVQQRIVVAQSFVAIGLQDGDAVAIFNFRSDRVIEISKAFEYEDFSAFDRKRFPKARSPAIALDLQEWRVAACVRGKTSGQGCPCIGHQGLPARHSPAA